MGNRLRTRIGLIVPSTNTTCEADFQMATPPDVTIHGHRLWITNDATDQNGMKEMNTEISSAAKYLATANVDVIAYGCTTGSFYKGLGWDKKLLGIIEDISGGIPAVGASTSVVDALNFLGAKKVSVATAYQQWNNEKLRLYLEQQGFEVMNVNGELSASQAGNQGINNQEPEKIVEFASKVCHPDADVLFCSCTAWRSMEAAHELEQLTGKPVITSNQTTIWTALRKVGLYQSIQGFGKLLENLGEGPK